MYFTTLIGHMYVFVLDMIEEYRRCVKVLPLSVNDLYGYTRRKVQLIDTGRSDGLIQAKWAFVGHC